MYRSLFAGVLVALVLVAPLSLFAQKPPLEWGKIPAEHLQMVTYPADTNAAAVILGDFGSITFDAEWGVTFRHHRRVKILKESGYDHGTVMIAYVADDRTQKVSQIKGQTCVAGASGKASCQKLSRKDIFKEDVDGETQRYRFTLPSLTPGAVIEYSYQIYSDTPVLVPEWWFQLSEPVLVSELWAEFPDELQYVHIQQGVRRYDVHEETKVARQWGNGRKYRFAMLDVPALREEPFMTRPDDYRTRIDFQLARYYQQGLGMVDFIRTWPQLASELSDHDRFGKQLTRSTRGVRNLVEEVAGNASGNLEKLRRLYDYVRTNVSWDGSRRYFPDQEIDEILRTKKGNSADVAFLLIALLREAGLDATPVLISTRNHGQIMDQYPVLTQFNHLLVHTSADGQEYLLDATDPHRPYHVLPHQALNGKGWLFTGSDARWIPISAGARDDHVVVVEADLSADGSLRGRYESADAGYQAVSNRRQLQDSDEELDWIREEALKGIGETSILSHQVANREDVYDSLRTSISFEVSGYAQAAGDYLYLNPMVVDRLDENPLKLEERKFPVDFGYPAEHLHRIQIRLPAGYEILELPNRALAAMPQNGGRYTRTVEVQDGVLVVEARFTRTQTAYYPKDYAGLRKFYADVVAADGTQVVLKRAQSGDGSSVGSGQ